MHAVKRLEQLGDIAARAEEVARDPRLQEALSLLAKDSTAARVALTAPREFLASIAFEVPDELDVSFFRHGLGIPPDRLPGKYEPDFEFFSIRLSNCRTYWVPTKDDTGKITGYHAEEVCLGFEVTPKYLPRGPWS